MSSAPRAASSTAICETGNNPPADHILGTLESGNRGKAANHSGELSMSFFITLVEMTDASRRDLELIPKVHSMMNHGLTLAEYRGFLHDLYHIVWHFCPVMSAAAARCDDRFRDVRYDLYERIEEEKGHDSWVLEDIEALGGDVRAVRETPPSPPAQAMIAFNYYASDRVHPCSVLGMLYMLEVVSSVYGGGAFCRHGPASGTPGAIGWWSHFV